MADANDVSIASALPPILAAPYRWVFDGFLPRVAGLIQLGTAGRGLPIVYLLVLLWLGLGTWLTPPINSDIHALELPLSGSRMTCEASTDLLYGKPGTALPTEKPGIVTRLRGALIGNRKIVVASVGTLIVGATALGILLIFIRARFIPHAYGLVTIAMIVGWMVTAMNHTVLVDELDRQTSYRNYLVAVLEATVKPELPLTVASRIGGGALTSSRGSLLRGTQYIPKSRELAIFLALAGLMLMLRGSMPRRVVLALLWVFAGIGVGGLVTSSRWMAEYAWQSATLADAQGDPDQAEQLARKALTRFPALGELSSTWEFLGKLDWRRGRDTDAARYFLAEQHGHWGDQLGMLEGLADLAATDKPAPAIFRWRAERTAAYAMKLFEQDKRDGAREYWNLAHDLDPAQRYLPLFDVLLTAVVERQKPDPLRDAVQPLLRDMPDNTLRCSLQSMLGDLYFECGQFVEARDWYNKSIKSYALPKQINYRAMRGLLGM